MNTHTCIYTYTYPHTVWKTPMCMLSGAFYNEVYTVISVSLAQDVPEKSCCQTCTLWCLPGAHVGGTPHSRPPRPCRSRRPGSTSSYTPQWSPAGPEANRLKRFPSAPNALPGRALTTRDSLLQIQFEDSEF